MKIVISKDATYKGFAYDIVPMGSVIGRSSESSIVLDSSGISRTHCRIARLEGKWVIEDLESSNGVFVNGQKIEKSADIFLNDTITLADTSFIFCDDESFEKIQSQLVHDDIFKEEVPESTPVAKKRSGRETMIKVKEKVSKNFSTILLHVKSFFKEHDISGELIFKILFVLTLCLSGYLYWQIRMLEIPLQFNPSLGPTSVVELTPQDGEKRSNDVVSSALLVMPLPEGCQVELDDGTKVQPMARTDIKGKLRIVRQGFLPIEVKDQVNQSPDFIPENGKVLIKSNISGAVVKLGDIFLGRTPCLISGLIAGEHTLCIGGEDTYENRAVIIMPNASEPGKVYSVNLKKRCVDLTFKTGEKGCSFAVSYNYLKEQADNTLEDDVFYVEANSVITLPGFKVGKATLLISKDEEEFVKEIEISDKENPVINL